MQDSNGCSSRSQPTMHLHKAIEVASPQAVNDGLS